MNYLKKRFYVQLLIICAAVLFAASCSKKEEKVYVSFFTGAVTIETAGEEASPVKVMDEVKDGDVIETGDKSYVIIQTGGGLIIRFDSDTRVVFESISSLEKRELSLNRGKVVSRVSKLKKGSEYNIKTPTAVASVRGTEFLTEYEKGKTTVAVGKGKVSVVKSETSEESLVETGNTAVVEESSDAAVEMREISKVEELEISKISEIPLVKPGDTEEAEKQLNEIENRTEEIDKEIEELMEKDSWTIGKIKAKYGRIDVVTLYNGRVIRGAIISRGSSVKILTPGGVVTVQSKDIRKTGVM